MGVLELVDKRHNCRNSPIDICVWRVLIGMLGASIRGNYERQHLTAA